MWFVPSEMCGDLDNLELGDTVEYTLSKGKGNKVSAEKVTKVAPGRRASHTALWRRRRTQRGALLNSVCL